MIDRETMKRLRNDIDALMKPLGTTHGLSIKLGNGSYTLDGKSGHFKLEITAEGTSLTAEALKQRYPQYVGEAIETPHGKYTIVGLKPRGTSFLIERIHDKKVFVMSISDAQFYLNRAVANA